MVTRLLIAALLVVGCGGPATIPSPLAAGREIHGTFVLSNGEPPDREAGCSGTGGYSDVGVGTDVVVRDAEGTIIGTSALAVDSQGPEPAGSGAYQCGFVFVVPNLPESTFYTVSVGRRGERTYSLAEMEASGWAVDFTLGD